MTDNYVPEPAQVVISGARPNSLLPTWELASSGIRPVVLDKPPSPSAESNANVLIGQIVRTTDMLDLYQACTGDDDLPQLVYR